ncbi:hypothetical protein LTR04_003443 [Oleoguttula sp. CCFEE 6159]|nr:hypothetical protein LTR04_003443 [Oleoguttula sp. CCFEE 6159]
MFKRSFASKDRAGKITKPSKRSFLREHTKQKLLEKLDKPLVGSTSPDLISAIITLVVGKDQRLFAAHEDVLSHSSFFRERCRDQFFEANARRVYLPDEQPEVVSAVLEYLYKGDYYPRLLRDKRHNTWVLQDITEPFDKNGGHRGIDPTIQIVGIGSVLRDTAVYCAAEKFGLEKLKGLALRKQGLQSGIEVGTILRSARYAYEHTPDNDSRLRAHYLALIIRSRKTFKRSGTMQMEMEIGGKMFFDLFVAMCNHMDDMVDLTQVPPSH